MKPEAKSKPRRKMYEYIIEMPYFKNKIHANHMDLMNDTLKFYLVDEHGISDLIACFKDWVSVTRKEIK